MAKRKSKAKRSRVVRDDASIASAENSIADVMGLPKGSIRLVNPDGRKARTDSTVEKLRAKYA